MIEPGNKLVTWNPQLDFRPGIYRHTKSGNLYSTIGIVFHHDEQRPMVMYVSLKFGTPAVRPLYGWKEDPDAWLDQVEVDAPVTIELPAEERVGASGSVTRRMPRFQWVRDVPTNTPLTSMVT
jgi:hypothetical protein